jgi:hypothetical protein
MLGILSSGTKLEANVRNSRNFILNHSVEEKQLGIPFCGTKI